MSAFTPPLDIADPDFVSKNALPKARRTAAAAFEVVRGDEPDFEVEHATKEQLAVDMARARPQDSRALPFRKQTPDSRSALLPAQLHPSKLRAWLSPRNNVSAAPRRSP